MPINIDENHDNAYATQNMIQLESTVQNLESVQEVSKVNRLGRSARPRQSATRSRDKSHADYWKQRLFRNSYSQDGTVIECGNLAVKIQHRGQRETFALKSSNRDMAAREAREIYTYALANGMAATVAKFKPDVAERIAFRSEEHTSELQSPC